MNRIGRLVCCGCGSNCRGLLCSADKNLTQAPLPILQIKGGGVFIIGKGEAHAIGLQLFNGFCRQNDIIVLDHTACCQAGGYFTDIMFHSHFLAGSLFCHIFLYYNFIAQIKLKSFVYVLIW
ncbi:MAG: hypothetical protein NDJ24_05160 [Alphaproteobacteria bacterium]|nr:hypothetical protein [Alphaproteobacteria bacterium]